MVKEITEEMFADNFIEELPRKRVPAKGRPKGKVVRCVLLRCLHCGNSFERLLANVLRTKQKCCSSSCYMRLTEAIEGGNEKHPLYSRWLAMRQRVYNPTNNSYKNYGKRGITIEDGLDDFLTYVTYITKLPKYSEENLNNLQLDRIDNNSNYRFGNLRWTDRSTQIANQRPNSRGFNKYTGICWSKAHSRWVARVDYRGSTYCSSTHSSQEEALKARNSCIKDNNLPHPIQVFTR